MLKHFSILILAISALALPAASSAAKLDMKDVSNTTLSCGQFPGHPDWCIGFPDGTLDLSISAEVNETADDVSDIYVIATLGGKFYAYNSTTTDPALRWVEVKPGQMPDTPTFTRAPFDGPTMKRQIYLGSHSKLKGLGLYVGAIARGKAISVANFKKAWDNP